MKVIQLLLAMYFLYLVPQAFAHPTHGRRIDILSERISAAPSDPSNYLERGRSFLEVKEWAHAENDFKKAASLDSKSGKPELYLARVFLNQGNSQLALKNVQQALAKNRQFVAALSLLSEVYASQGKFTLATNALKKILLLHPHSGAEVYLSIDQLLERSAGTRFEERVEMLEQGIERLGPLVVLLSKLIELEIERNNPQAALANLALLPPKIGTQPQWLVQKAFLLEKLNRCEESQVALQKARERIDGLHPRRRGSKTTQALLQQIAQSKISSCHLKALPKQQSTSLLK